jgi:FtsP/CotA-like multicopper oxidase with cupredoxin domain
MERREVLKLGALGAVAAGGLAIPLSGAAAKSASTLADRNMPRPYAAKFRRPPVLKPYGYTDDDTGRTALYSVTAKQADASIVPGLTTKVWAYNGTFPGPTISVDQNVHVRLRVRNKLPTTHPVFGHPFYTSTHLHGSASLPQFDGYASDITRVGEVKEYLYPDYQGARTLWYHDHAVHNTAKNAYTGLAAQYHLHDSLERAQLPQGEFDVPVTITDAMFSANGQFSYNDKGVKSLWGDVILVNGVPWPVMRVKRRVYRFRILVASISRSYKLRLSNAEPLTIVATDGGLVPVPQPVASIRAGSAERYEVLVDFSKYAAGTKIDLLNSSNPNNVNFDHTGKVMRFEVVDGDFDGANNTIPTVLDIGPIGRDTMALTTAKAKRTTKLKLKHDDITNEWSINGMTWGAVVASHYRQVLANPQIGDIEIWEIENSSDGWFHPVHIHLVDFKIFARNTNGGKPFPWELGPKDVVYVGERETVKVLAHFTVGEGSSGGRYMIHCHNLVHEDHDMMTQFRVGTNDFDNDPNDPIAAARPEWDDAGPDDPEYEPAYPLGT